MHFRKKLAARGAKDYLSREDRELISQKARREKFARLSSEKIPARSGARPETNFKARRFTGSTLLGQVDSDTGSWIYVAVPRYPG